MARVFDFNYLMRDIPVVIKKIAPVIHIQKLRKNTMSTAVQSNQVAAPTQ